MESRNFERLNALNKELLLDQKGAVKLEEVLKRHFRLLRESFKHYSTSLASGQQGVDLKGLLKLFQASSWAVFGHRFDAFGARSAS